jgi:hypothetical protein
VQTNIGHVLTELLDVPDEIVLDDGSGRVARVALKGATVRMEEKSFSADSKRISGLVQARGYVPSKDGGEFYWESCVRPGDVVSIAGTIAPREGGYRDAAEVVLTSDAGALIVFDAELEREKLATHRSGMKLAIFFAIVGALGTAISLYVVMK